MNVDLSIYVSYNNEYRLLDIGDKGIMKKYSAIIPARAGSKGIIGKNIIDICGKPLIAWSIDQALNSSRVSNVYVSTDGDDIARISEEYGAKVIWRPSELASDTASSEDAIIHAVNEINESEQFNSVVFLQATSPIRRENDIDDAIRTYEDGNYDSLFSMAVMDDYCLWEKKDGKPYSFSYDYKERGRRQEREPLYLENGSIYVFKKELLLTQHNRLGGRIGMYEMPYECSYEIDSEKDISVCEFFINQMTQEEGMK